MPRRRKGGNVNFKVGRKNVSMKWTRPYILNKLTGLCAPALLYLVLSLFGFLTILFQNCKEASAYMIGDMKVDIECHNAWFFVGKAVYIMAFTWLLNVLCNKGYTNISWFLVLLPFIGMFLILGLIMLSIMKKEGFKEGADDDDDDDDDDEDKDKDKDKDEDKDEDEEKENNLDEIMTKAMEDIAEATNE